MAMMVGGLLLWSVVHLIPSVAPTVKQAWKGRLGDKAYMGSFSLLLLVAVALIVLGWRATLPTFVYQPEEALRLPALVLIVVAFILLGAPNYATRIKRIVRHPQLTGLIIWAAAHLLLNGDSRSVLLFGWLAVWAVVEIVCINRRDGAWIKPEVPPWGAELRGGLISLAVLIAVVLLHPYISGVPIS